MVKRDDRVTRQVGLLSFRGVLHRDDNTIEREFKGKGLCKVEQNEGFK